MTLQDPRPATYASAAGTSPDVVARLMQLHQLAKAAAAALLLLKPLAPADEASLLLLCPWLLRLTALAPRASACSPFAAAASIVLAQRPDAPAVAPASLTLPSRQQQLQACSPSGATLRFDLMGALSADQTAELQVSLGAERVLPRPHPMLPHRVARHSRVQHAIPPPSLATQVFEQQVNRGIEQSSKAALEDALSELSRLPSASAMVRSSIEGQQNSMRSLHSLLSRRSGSLSLDSLASTPLHHASPNSPT